MEVSLRLLGDTDAMVKWQTVFHPDKGQVKYFRSTNEDGTYTINGKVPGV